jgi:hypothetical protein
MWRLDNGRHASIVRGANRGSESKGTKLVDRAAQKRTQDAIARSRKAAKRLRNEAAQTSGPKRAALLKDAADYDEGVRHLLRTCADLGVR